MSGDESDPGAPVLVSVDGAVAVVTLNRPQVRNALSAAVVEELGQVVSSLDADPAVHAVVLTGADPAFCAGFDLRQLASELRGVMGGPPGEAGNTAGVGPGRAHGAPDGGAGPAGGAPDGGTVPTGYLGLLPPHATPIIGAVNGAAVTGGLELALGCDFLVASDRARFADTHARVGAMPGAGLTIRLPELIGIDRARLMSLTGDFIDARRAYEWGLVVEVVPHDRLLERAGELARAVASIPAANVAEIRWMYAEMATLRGQAAWRRENELARRWMAERFDQDRLARERRAIIQRGREGG